MSDNNLPLVSNIDDILVDHYNFSFKCDFSKKSFECVAVLFLKPTDDLCLGSSCGEIKHGNNILESSFVHSARFELLLDCNCIKVSNVSAVDSFKDSFIKFVQSDPASILDKGEELKFSVKEWSLRISLEKYSCKHKFPKIIKISYVTLTSSPSLLWVNDQDNKPAVFSYGSFINNRALFPCQEHPTAMATWEAVVVVPDSAIVLMSGDEEASISKHAEWTHYYYYTKQKLPMSTLSLAIGSWKEHVISSTLELAPTCRIFTCSKLFDKAVSELYEYIPDCLQRSREVFGVYPFPRIDFLIVPPTFGSLGMASPNIVFLSQSVLAGDGSMCSRVAHEIAHGWFGLLLGAMDWSEEWLSEGFATFMEDLLHVETVNMDRKEDYLELKALIRKKTLLAEVKNTEEELQVIRPSQGEVQKMVVDGDETEIVKNGQNPSKAFTQVHYIKGYFLLKHLCDIVGTEAFKNFLQNYVKQFAGKLVTSVEFIEMFRSHFCKTKKPLVIENIFDNWLHCSEIPSEVAFLQPSAGNVMYKEVEQEILKWKNYNDILRKKNPRKRVKRTCDTFCHLTAEQTILLLEEMLEEEKVSRCTLKDLNKVFCFKETNAEVQHRWYELVVKHKYSCEYQSLKQYLIDNVAMGIYLYGEMIFSGNSAQKKIAADCYATLKSEMEPNFQSILNKMFDSEI